MEQLQQLASDLPDEEKQMRTPEQRERIFEPTVSTRENGSGGLGLAICRRLVEEAGGSIEVIDAPGGGARFRVRLRRAPR